MDGSDLGPQPRSIPRRRQRPFTLFHVPDADGAAQGRSMPSVAAYSVWRSQGDSWLSTSPGALSGHSAPIALEQPHTPDGSDPQAVARSLDAPPGQRRLAGVPRRGPSQASAPPLPPPPLGPRAMAQGRPLPAATAESLAAAAMHRPPGGGGPRDGALELMVGDVLSRRHQFEDSVRQLEQRPLGSASSVGAPSSSATSADTTRTPSHASGPARTNPPAQHREAAQSISDQLHDPPHADGALPAIGFDADTLKALATLNEQLRLRANRALGTPDTLKQPHAKIGSFPFGVHATAGGHMPAGRRGWLAPDGAAAAPFASLADPDSETAPLLVEDETGPPPIATLVQLPWSSHTGSSSASVPSTSAGQSRSQPQSMLHRAWQDLTFEVYRNKGLRHGFQVGVAIVIATLLNFVDAFREPINGKAWAAITVIATYEATYGGFLRKALQRIIGTALGGAIGLLIVAVAFALPPRCFQCAYKPWMLSAALFIVTVIVSYLKLQRPRDSYVFTVMIMTVLIVVLGEYGDPSHEEDWDPAVPFYLRPFYESAIYRIGLVISGVAISFVVSTLVFPERASTRLPETIGGIMLKIADLQAFVHDSYLDVDEESFSMSAFRDKALVQADSISRDLEKLRTSVDNALGEILLSASEAQATEYAPVCIRDIERIFYLTVTMVYGRMWTDSCALHRVLNNQLAVLIEMLDTSLRATAHVFQRRLIHPRSHDIDPELFSSAMFPLLRDAVLMTLHIFQQQQAELHRSYLSLAFGEMDWTNWNHYSLSFMQCLVNLAGVIDAGIDMHDLDA